MDAEEILDEICEALVGNIEEPAGRGCGYGVTDDGLAGILAVIKRILPQNRKECIMKEQTLFSYAVTETTKSKDDNGQIDSKKLKILGTGIIPAFDHENAKIKAMAATKTTGADMDEVKAVVANFPG